jgi:tape measure domain-containing protein
MAATEQKFNIKVATQGTESLTTLKAKLANLGKEVNATKTGFQGAAAEIKKVQSNADQSVNSLRNFASSWRELANSVNITSKEFRIYTREAEKAELIAARASGKPGMGFKGAAQTVGTVAAAGVFGGPEGAIGALLGSAAGPAGAVVGGAIGASVGGVRQALGAAAAYSAELDKQRTALRQVIGSQVAYDQSLKFIKQTSAELAIPQDIVIKNFTRLSASVIGAGGNINDAEKVFKGISAGILGTGGSLENLDSALLATAQVFSKGKVSAEELRGQIGERLPGAFTIFAESIGKTPQQLDKALQEGQVSLTDFQTFSEALFQRYGDAAKIIASSPENAGNRLKVTLSNLSESIGTLLRPIGAAFQNTFSFIAELIDAAITKLNFFLKLDPTGRKASLKTQIAADQKSLEALRAGQVGMSPAEKAKFAKAINAPLESRLIANKALLASMGTPFREPGKGLGVSGDGGGGSGAASKATENAAKRLAIQTEKQLDAAFKLNVLAQEKLDVQMSTTDEEKLQAELDKVAVERRLKFAELQKKALSEKERELLISAQLSTIFIDNNKAQKAKQDLLTKQTEELYLQIGLADVLGKKFQAALGGAFNGDSTAGQFRTDLNLMPGLTGGELGTYYEELQTQFKDLITTSNQVKTAAESIGTAFGDTFKGLISGTTSAREAFAGFFQSIADYFADMVAQLISQYIKMQIIGLAQQFLPSFGGIFGAGGATNYSGAFGSGGLGSSQFMPGVPSLVGGRAAGGPVAGSGAYLVGERGPELFMPGRSGSIVPNGGMGNTSVVVNVDASGNSNVQGDQTQAKQLGVAVSAAVQAELVKQQRPGGLLAGTRR